MLLFLPRASQLKNFLFVNLGNQLVTQRYQVSWPSVLRFYDHILFSATQFCMKMMFVLTLALFVGLASSRPSDKAIGKDQNNQQNLSQ